MLFILLGDFDQAMNYACLSVPGLLKLFMATSCLLAYAGFSSCWPLKELLGKEMNDGHVPVPVEPTWPIYPQINKSSTYNSAFPICSPRDTTVTCP